MWAAKSQIQCILVKAQDGKRENGEMGKAHLEYRGCAVRSGHDIEHLNSW